MLEISVLVYIFIFGSCWVSSLVVFVWWICSIIRLLKLFIICVVLVELLIFVLIFGSVWVQVVIWIFVLFFLLIRGMNLFFINLLNLLQWRLIGVLLLFCCGRLLLMLNLQIQFVIDIKLVNMLLFIVVVILGLESVFRLMYIMFFLWIICCQLKIGCGLFRLLQFGEMSCVVFLEVSFFSSGSSEVIILLQYFWLQCIEECSLFRIGLYICFLVLLFSICLIVIICRECFFI